MDGQLLLLHIITDVKVSEKISNFLLLVFGVFVSGENLNWPVIPVQDDKNCQQTTERIQTAPQWTLLEQQL